MVEGSQRPRINYHTALQHELATDALRVSCGNHYLILILYDEAKPQRCTIPKLRASLGLQAATRQYQHHHWRQCHQQHNQQYVDGFDDQYTVSQ